MGLVVTGISPDGNVNALVAALKRAGLATEAVSVIEPGDAPSSLGRAATVRGPEHFTGDRGTSVPGLTNSEPSGMLQRPGPLDDPLLDRLEELGIPDDEIENYLEALGAGRSVIAYAAHTETAVEPAAAAFREAGLAKVKRF